ncbi:MAG: TIGR04283 family arsenosugar biosynthesis glycosyltransferase [Rhodospirillaceae bacterium]|nr:TIGR04283 family arsenosugar biosynthesis glycosyltransferase [Rhodospirillaceae bacterium]
MPNGFDLSVIVPALNAAAALPQSLAAVRACPDVAQVIVSDGGSADGTVEAARQAGAQVVTAARGRGAQMAAGAGAAVAPWLLFLHADTVLQPGWSVAARAFMDDPAHADHAGYFSLRFDDDAPAARRLERIVAWRCRWLALPYGDQGLLIRRAVYERIGGFRPLPIMEDVDLIQRIPRTARIGLDGVALTSARRYRQEGYLMRPARNVICQAFWRLGVPAVTVARWYR